MTEMVIYCNTCKTNWKVLERDDFHDSKYKQCPLCGKKINDQTWEKFILPAFGSLIDTNIELVKDAIQNGEMGFCISTKARISDFTRIWKQEQKRVKNIKRQRKVFNPYRQRGVEK